MPTAWEVDTAVYENKYLDCDAQAGDPNGMFFKPDGLKVYVAGYGPDKVVQYSLSVAWDIDTAIYSKYKSITSEETALFSIFFRADGLKMYIVGITNKKVFQYALSTPWEVDTAVYENKFKYVGSQESQPHGLFFKPDGLKMYICGPGYTKILQYVLSVAWDVETATYENKYKNVSSETTSPASIFFKPDGTRVYVAGFWANAKIFQYLLSTPWEVDSAVYEDKYKDVVGRDIYPVYAFFKFNGLKMYLVGRDSEMIYQYDLPAAEPEGQPFALRRRDRYIGGVMR